MERILAARWPASDPETRVTVVRLVVLAGDGLLREAFRIDPAGDPTVIAESKRMLNAYITERLGVERLTPQDCRFDFP